MCYFCQLKIGEKSGGLAGQDIGFANSLGTQHEEPEQDFGEALG